VIDILFENIVKRKKIKDHHLGAAGVGTTSPNRKYTTGTHTTVPAILSVTI
jgi:hypothetical protein